MHADKGGVTVPTETAGAIPPPSDILESLRFASPADLARIEAQAIKEKALLSPLDYAIHVSEGRIKPYAHTEVLSLHAKAVIERRLYPSGIGPTAVWRPDDKDPEDGKWVHPETGEQAHNILVVSAPPQHGKANKCSTPVFTPEGWVAHGDLRPGDRVFHPSGQPTEVVAVTAPVDDEMLRVTFFDGSVVDCHPNHEWTVYDRNRKSYRTIEAREMIGTYSRARYSLPHQDALQMPEADLPLDPYFLGAWLGDGCASAPTICGAADDLRFIVAQVPHMERGFHTVHKTTGVHYQGFKNRVITTLRALDLYKNKHIPTMYLTASEAQRRDLLAGLVDTDGHWSVPGKQFVFVTASRRLADDVRLLVRSLGYRAGLVVRRDDRDRDITSTGECYAVTWTPHDGLGGGRLDRKQGGHSGLRRRIGVRSVVPVAPEPMNCIQVASEDGLYLVGEALTPTHNSAIITETVPAWYLTRYPHNRVIVTGYEADFAKGFGRANRQKIESTPEFGVFVDKQTRAADEWQIAGHDGGMVTAGAGGAITGRRADLICIDDPVKNSEEALSQAARRKNKQWWESTVKSRIRTNTVVIVIQTRWHEDDLAGHILKTERCYRLNLPAIAFEEADPKTGVSIDPDDGTPDPLGRKPGEALCPQLQTRSMLLTKMESGDGGDEPGGVLWFSALYQGKPNIEGGGYLGKPFRYFTVEENFRGRRYFRTRDSQNFHRESFLNECIWFVTSDLAVSTKTHADYTVFSLFAWTPYNQLLLVDMFRKRVPSTEHMQEAEAFWRNAKRWSDGAGIRFFGVEAQTFGIGMIQGLRKHARIPVKELKADKDKIARAIPVGMMIRQDEFFLPKGASFLPELEHEMTTFPNGSHDDMVDTLGYAVEECARMPRRSLEARPTHAQELEVTRRKRRNRMPYLGRI